MTWKPIAAKYMSKLMDDFGMAPEDAAAVMGNFLYETNGFKWFQELNPTVPGSRGGWGWAQWTGPRRRAMEAYARRNNLDLDDHETNYKWLWNELQGPEKRAVPAVKAAPTLEQKVIAFERTFERAGVKRYDKRLAWAERALEAYYDALPDRPVTPPSDALEAQELIARIRSDLILLERLIQ